MKLCNRCGETKPNEGFAKNATTGDKLQGICRDCDSKIKKSRRSGDGLKMEKLSYRYGIDVQDFNDMRQAQRGLCAICLFPHAELLVDHCHETGKVRGLLCRKCNSGIGLLRDDPEVVMAAALYLEKHSDYPTRSHASR